jgi:hypothetical protein
MRSWEHDDRIIGVEQDAPFRRLAEILARSEIHRGAQRRTSAKWGHTHSPAPRSDTT